MAGLGDSGLLTAIHLAGRCDVVGISTKPGLVSGQELGLRLARPEAWQKEYRVDFARYHRLRHARTVHGTLTSLDLDARQVVVRLPDGSEQVEGYDVLVVATGVTNGFWRRPGLQTTEDVDADLADHHARVASAASVAVVGGGAAAVSSAAQIASRWPDKHVDLYFPGERALPRHHGRVWRRVRRRFEHHGVGLHAGHRAELPAEPEPMASATIRWQTGQPATEADAVLWAVGRVSPNTGWLPPELLDDDGFVRVEPDLRVPDRPGVFAIGDVAATDPLRTTARNSGHRLLARNVRAHLDGRTLRAYRPPGRRWGSVLGPLHDGLLVFAPSGRAFRFPAWTHDHLLRGVIVRWGIYRGISGRRSVGSAARRRRRPG